MLVRIGIAASIQGVSASTMRRWEREEKILPYGRTRGGHKRYKLSQMLGEEEQEEENNPQTEERKSTTRQLRFFSGLNSNLSIIRTNRRWAHKQQAPPTLLLRFS